MAHILLMVAVICAYERVVWMRHCEPGFAWQLAVESRLAMCMCSNVHLHVQVRSSLISPGLGCFRMSMRTTMCMRVERG